MIGTSVCTPVMPDGRLGIGLGLFFERVRRVVGAEHVDHALLSAAPDRVAMLAPAHRRVHLQLGSEPRDSPRRSSVRWCGVASQLATSLAPARNSISSRVETCSTWTARRASRARRTSRSVERSAAISSRQTGCEAGSPERARACARRGAPRLRCGKRRGGASSSGSPARPRRQATRRLPVEEPMNTLIPDRAGQALEFGKVGDVVVRPADPEGVVAMHAPLRARRACRRAPRRWSSAVGVGHLEHRR